MTNMGNIPQPPRYINALSEMLRWEKFPTMMIHRPSLYIHRERTKAIAQFVMQLVITPSASDLEIIDFLATHHDDHEIIDTDKPSPEKEEMSPKEKKKEFLQEISGFEKVAREYLQLDENDFKVYMDAMRSYQLKDTLVTQVVDVADKLDGIGESLHEIRCGNIGFFDGYQYYREKKLLNFTNYPFWKKLIKDPAIEFDPMPTLDELIKLPRLRAQDLKSRNQLKSDMDDSSLPAWYKSWLSISYDLFSLEPQPEFHIFPGWKNELRLRWNYPH